jgi:hypothetical protein
MNMGQRLNIEIVNNNKILANAYYHWSAYSQTSLEMTKKLIEYIQKNDFTDDVKGAIKLLETTGALLVDSDMEYAKGHNLIDMNYDNSKLNRNDGLMSISEEGIKSNQSWAEGTIRIYLDSHTFAFNCLYEHDCMREDEEVWELIKHLFHHTRIKSFHSVPFSEIDYLLKSVEIAHKTYNGRICDEYGAKMIIA